MRIEQNELAQLVAFYESMSAENRRAILLCAQDFSGQAKAAQPPLRLVAGAVRLGDEYY